MDASRSQVLNPPNEPHGGRRKSFDETCLFIMEVKETFHDQEDKYYMFIKVLKDAAARRCQCRGTACTCVNTTLARVKELFTGHNNLVIGFNSFMPPGYKITIDDEEEEDSIISTARDH